MSSIYNGTRILPELVKQPTALSPYEKSSVDYLNLIFNQRICLDITVNKANSAPKVVTISTGNFVNIKFHCDGKLYQAIGKVSGITFTPHPKAPMQTRTFTPTEDICKGETFIITIDCSDKCESRLYDIHSCDIRDIDLITDKNNSDEHHHHDHKPPYGNSDCDKCPYNPNNKPSGGDTKPPTDVDITPDTDLEEDYDFGTDSDDIVTDEPKDDLTNDSSEDNTNGSYLLGE